MSAAEKRAGYVAALKEEREGYVKRGLADRVAQVDAELARFDAAPKKRTAAKKTTTEG
ncbi:MAG: hypothetical protein IPN92_21040 [Chromatiaceae bacterium]|nr:hypothetical protein [Chromatiaceae bacterium]